MIKLSQIQLSGETGLKGKFYFAGKFDNSIGFFVNFTLSLFDSLVWFPFNKENELNLKHSGEAELRNTRDIQKHIALQHSE